MENLHKLIDSFTTALFQPEVRRLQHRVNELDRQNGEIRHERAYGFHWQGHWFFAEGSPTKGNRLPALDFQLRKEGDDLLRDHRAVVDDRKAVGQTMFLLLKDCKSLQEIRDALPDSLAELSSDLQRLPRTQEAGYTLSTDRHRRQYQQMLDKIDFYAATRLMY